VGPALVLALEVTNRDSQMVTFQEALHSYFAVRDIREVTITGLEQASYLDRLAGPEPVPPSAKPIRIAAETDRIYLDTTSPVTIVDPGLRRAITISKAGSRSTVVWNPWVDKARAMSDFGDDEWTEMVCVETCNIGASEVRLEPGGRHTMTATIEIAGGE
jgi:D-hexose-6-phosphate mutarotase